MHRLQAELVSCMFHILCDWSYLCVHVCLREVAGVCHLHYWLRPLEIPPSLLLFQKHIYSQMKRANIVKDLMEADRTCFVHGGDSVRTQVALCDCADQEGMHLSWTA